MNTAFTDLVGCRVPIQQAPMPLVAGPELVVAVADAGGLGTTSALMQSAESLGDGLAEMTARTNGALAVNFLPDVDRAALEVAAERARVVDFFWFDPDPALVQAVHDGGALACWQVGSADEARAAVDAGCDVVVAQGTEAGGHIRAVAPLDEVLAAVLDAVDVPVLAAGGIADAAALARVLDAGAAGARIGTRFIATTESSAHPDYKRAIVDAGDTSTEITDAFTNGCPLCATGPRRPRALRRAIDAVLAAPDDVIGELWIDDAAIPIARGSGIPPSADASGDVSAMAMYAGESAAAVRDIVPAAEVIVRLMMNA
jgi:nitronate monooxygenase